MDIMDALKQVTSSIKNWADDDKVQKVSGKGLSTNDYTNSDKNKLSKIDEMPNDLVILDGKLYLAQNGVIIDDSAVTLPSGGGGSGSSGSVALKNNLTSTIITAAVGSDVLLQFNYSSSEDETGDGTAYIYVGNVLKMTTKISPGDNIINISSCVGEGTNIIKLTCMDQYSNSRSLSYTANIVSLKLSSNFDATVPYDGDISYTYTPVGDVIKTVHVILDGKEIGTAEVTTSGRQQTYMIPKQSHGSHTLEVYFTAEFNDEEVQSNHLYYDLMFVTSGETTPIISCSYSNTEMVQFETIIIPYVVYSPVSLTSNIILSANGKTVNELAVDRTQQTWAYRADEYGELTLTISCGETVKTINLNVAKSQIDVEATTDNLELYLSSYGRSNNEINPASWSYGDIACTFENYNWTSDGWLTDEDGITVHRVTGNARLTIPLKMFASDFRTTGKTIEFEFSTSNVRDYDTEVISCYSGNIGFKLTAQMATLKSEQSELSTQYKEDEHIRLSFVIEKRAENRLIYIYLNGIMCGVAQYPTDDDFTQASPVDITIGSNDCIIDLYNIRVYNNDLTKYQILDNWIADTQDIALKTERYARNNIYDAYGNVVIENLPTTLPYMILICDTLPQYKGNKLSMDGEFVDPANPNKSFTFTGAQGDVQGTSSSGYKRKNYKLKFKNGIEQNGETKDGYSLRDDGLTSNVFTFKADVASSEGANNVELVRFYNDTCPYKTPAQEKNPLIRQGIDGFPIVIFHNNGESTKFVGKYNMNWDKSSDVYGFGSTDSDESWETLNNTSDRVLYKSADFSGTDWTNDFEARYPEDNMDISNLADFAAWVVSTDRNAATGEALPSAVTYDGVTYDKDTADYRLAKFRAEITDHAELDSSLFYYLISDLALAIDNRAKNTFPSIIGDSKIWWAPYDWDSCLGIDNSGNLKFSYDLEDTDTTESGADVYNGQQSVYWCNIRDAFGPELKTMYQTLRSNNKWSYDIVEKMFEDHQSAWCEAIWNEDMWTKYCEPFIEDGASIYLPMLQGSKSEQRKWWLYNRFRYIDSKYNAGDSLKDFITLRGYAKSDITVTPYASIYASIKYGSYLVQKRALRGGSYILECPLDNVNDTEIYIYSASQLKDVGDLSGLKVGLADFSMANRLQSLKLGDSSSSYSNGNLTNLTLGNNVLLKTIDARNCINLGTGEQQTLDLTGCTNIEEVYLEGTSVKGVNLPNGGILKTLHVPDTITNLTIRNQASLTDFVLNDSSNITTLRLENVGALIDSPKIIMGMADGGRVRATDINWTVSSEDELVALFNKIVKMRGLDENGNNTDKAVLSGRCHVNEKVSDSVIGNIYNEFPDVVIDDGSDEIYIISYKDWDGSILYSLRLAEGANAIDPISEGYISAPFRDPDENYSYEFVGWNMIPTNVSRNYQVIAQYKTMVAVNFAVDGVIIHSEYVTYGSNAEDPVANGTIEAPTKEGTDDLHYVFDKWDGSLLNVTLPRTLSAIFANVYPVRFYSDSNMEFLHYVQWVIEGQDASDPVASGDAEAPEKAETTDIKYSFVEWSSIPTNVTSIVEVYATYIENWAVRFYNDSVLVYTQWVRNGSNAIDPIANGDILTPTRASTAQYDYTFSRWNGDFENVTESRSMTAVYSSTIRHYTVYFYNNDTLLQTVENVQYGSGTSYTGSTPTKLGVDNPEEYVFKGWAPTPTNITGDTICRALFRFTGYITDDWDVIKANVENGTATSLYPIGGRKEYTFTIDDITYTADVEIVGHNHDDLADGSGKAALTWVCKDLSDYMIRFNNTNTNLGGWENSEARTICNGVLYDSFPEKLQAAISEVNKLSDGGIDNKTLVTTVDKVFILSYDELAISANKYSLSGQGEAYSSTFTEDKETRKKYLSDGTTAGYITRSSYLNDNSPGMIWRVTNVGGTYSDLAFNKFNICFGFCI